MKITRNGMEFELTPAELEQAYREKKHYYLLCDADSQLMDFCNADMQGVVARCGFKREDLSDPNAEHYMLEKFVAAFENHHDCEQAENDVWQEVIRNVLIANAVNYEVTYDASYDLYLLGMVKATTLFPSYASLEELHEAAPAYIATALERHGVCNGEVLVRTTIRKVRNIGGKGSSLKDWDFVKVCWDRQAVLMDGKLRFVEE